VNAWLAIFEMTKPYRVWAEYTGHTRWKRTDMLCVNGCWTYSEVEWFDYTPVTKIVPMGTIHGGTRAEREAQLTEVLRRPPMPSK
jgi:hypothetical protein